MLEDSEMTQVLPDPDPVRAAPPPPPPAQSAPAPVMPLEYGRPAPRGTPELLEWIETSLLVAGFRRLVLAVGAGLLAAGLVEAIDDSRYGGDAQYTAGWGAALIVLVVPWPRLLRRRRPSADPAGPPP